MVAVAQEKIYFEHQGPQVLESGREKSLAWAGGINAPQFAQADLNNDGTKDLVLFETGHSVKTFICSGSGSSTTYRYAPEYQYTFPELLNYIKLVDYNRDGIADLIHRGGAGYAVYKGFYNNENKLAFSFYKDLFYFLQGSGDINAYCEPMDIPGVADVDNDGDIDFLSFDISGGFINFYRNCQEDNLLPKDSIVICLKDNCWGKTFQGVWRTQVLAMPCSQSGVSCKGCPENENNRTTHTGNTLCLYDYDRDGDIDYFTGNVSYPEVQYVQNGRIEHSYGIDTMVAQDTIWGVGGKDVHINTWVASFVIDAENDGDDDFIFTPHSTAAENYKSAILYRNNGTQSAPSYFFVSDSFLVADMIDIGAGSYPVFYDYNKDGLQDLLVGSDGYYNATTATKLGAIAYFENTGTSSQPQFTLRNRNLLDLSGVGYRGVALAIGDLDNDGKDDLVLGHTNGTVSFYTNTAATNTVQPVWVLSQQGVKDKDGVDINVGGFAAPCIYDIDKDAKPDLLIGSQAGYVFYYKNISAGSGLSLQFGTSMLGAMKAGNQFSEGYSTVYVGRVDNTNTEYIMLGSLDGEISKYDGFQSGNVTTAYTRVDSFYSRLKISRRTAPAFADLYGDNKYDMVLGNDLGGLHYLKQYFNAGVADVNVSEAEVNIYPNPAANEVTIERIGNTAALASVKIIAPTGQILISKELTLDRKTTINTSVLPAGLYYCVILNEGKQIAKPLMILR
jgi:FG-GAP repeat.